MSRVGVALAIVAASAAAASVALVATAKAPGSQCGAGFFRSGIAAARR